MNILEDTSKHYNLYFHLCCKYQEHFSYLEDACEADKLSLEDAVKIQVRYITKRHFGGNVEAFINTLPEYVTK